MTAAAAGAARAPAPPGRRGVAARAADRVRLGADDRRGAERRRAAPPGLLARPALGRLGRYELLLALPELRRARALLPRLRRRAAQAVRDRGVGDLGRRRAGLREPAVRLDRVAPARSDGALQPG